jgi:DNA polymerase-3 subunit gamma/tau
MRDSISLLGLCASSGEKIDVSVVNETIGSAGRELMMDVAGAVADKNFEFLFAQIDTVISSSKDITVFWQDLISLYRDLLVVKTVKDSAKYLDLTDFEAKKLSSLAEKFTREMLIYHCKMLEEALSSMQVSGAVKRIIAELCFVKMCDDNLSTSNEALLLRLSRLEAKIASGELLINASGAPEIAQEEKKEEKKTVKTEQKAKIEDKKPQITFAPEPVFEAKKVAPTQNSEGKKPLKAWSEAVQTIQELDKGAYAFLKKTRAYLSDDGRAHVLYDGFGLFAMDKADIKKALAAALSKYLERSFTEQDIVYEQDNGKIRIEDDQSDLDAFNDFINN